jgi:dethiobiotin synthetase
VTCALAAWCRRAGLRVGVMKPVATGGRRAAGGRGWVADDARRLAAAARSADPMSLVNPVCYGEPLAPTTAAARAGRPIRLDRVRRAFRRLQARHDFVLVEGVGGLLVPLTARGTVADLARALGLPVVVVARPDLGTINHTLLTLAALRRGGLRLEGVIVNAHHPSARTGAGRIAARTNPAALRRFGRVRILGVLPYAPAVMRGPRGRSTVRLAAWAERHLDRRWLASLLKRSWAAQRPLNGGRFSFRRRAVAAKREMSHC